MTKKELLDLVGEFGWSFHYRFFIETSAGNFVWHDPDYPDGDNTIRRVNYSLKRFCKKNNIPYVRDKGRHTIREYCGEEIVLVGE